MTTCKGQRFNSFRRYFNQIYWDKLLNKLIITVKKVTFLDSRDFSTNCNTAWQKVFWNLILVSNQAAWRLKEEVESFAGGLWAVHRATDLPMTNKELYFCFSVLLQCWAQSIFGDTVYSCYCKFRLMTPHGGGWGDENFWFWQH